MNMDILRTSTRHHLMTLVLAVSLLVAGTALAARAPAVDLADLAQVSAEGQDTLKDVQHKFHLTETALSGAEAAVDEAKEELKTSRSTLSGRKADLKVAKQEKVAARKNDDDERMKSANDGISAAKAALAETKARLSWAKKNLSAAKAVVGEAEAQLVLAQANLELARAELLASEGLAAAESYALSDFRGHQARQAQSLHKASEKAQKKVGAAERAKSTWERKMLDD